ncbi:MAG: IPT/TIG domain-containing protein [Verrucomicrobiota bacterium]
MKAKRILPTSLFALSTLFIGCSIKIANLTPPTVPTNPSGIYTLTAQAQIQSKAVDPNSLYAFVVIDGEQRQMAESDLGKGFFDYDYTIPEGSTGADFYYILNYRNKTLTDAPGEVKAVQSGPQRFSLVNRYSISLDAERAPIGSQIAVLGRGFSNSDTVFIGGRAAQTVFVSPNALQFIVPSLPAGAAYAVEVRSTTSSTPAGMLRVDPGNPLSVLPAELNLRSGERQALAFALEKPAPQGGLYLNVTTDVPQSVIMPEVIIPEGMRTVNITVEGGEPGAGSLFIKATNLRELVIPISVR